MPVPSHAVWIKNAPCTFQNIIKEVLGTYWRKFVMAYLHDLIIYSANEQKHIYHLGLIFECREIYGLPCNLQEWHFGKTKLPYLDHLGTSEGNQATPESIQTIKVATPPRTRKEVRSFLGTYNWILEYLPNFSMVVTPLADLLCTTKPYKWNPMAQEVFENLHTLAYKPLKLSRCNSKLPFILQTPDASTPGELDLDCMLLLSRNYRPSPSTATHPEINVICEDNYVQNHKLDNLGF